MGLQWIKRVCCGEEKLQMVFWGYGCVQALIFAVMSGVLIVVEKAPLEHRLITPNAEREIMDVWGLLVIGWGILIVLNSKNTKGRIYTYLARLFALLAVLFMLACIGSGWDA